MKEKKLRDEYYIMKDEPDGYSINNALRYLINESYRIGEYNKAKTLENALYSFDQPDKTGANMEMEPLEWISVIKFFRKMSELTPEQMKGLEKILETNDLSKVGVTNLTYSCLCFCMLFSPLLM